ncbi:transglycosylase domain-containing protein [Streptomyces fuscigenes]|uniref:transglycosylase domain-containing protein n=1 Tax=Streptomyces fuscigenes TaxID=1528880 RepID=UPI001F348444|nr:transglycosylase domain-containing protein [Streptomyces fuscigenes]MCF3960936.1 penicillin-binding protein [Streptomyces fuscigenes]
MSEHRRKMPPPQGGGRAAARRGAQQPSGRRAAPSRGDASASHSGSAAQGGRSASHGADEQAYGGRAAARKAAQRGGRRREPDPAAGGRGRGRGPTKKRFIDYPRFNKYGWRRWMPSWRLTSALVVAFLGSLLAAGSVAYALVQLPNQSLASKAENNVFYWSDGTPMVSTGGENNTNRQIISIDQIPRAMQDAVVSQENRSFYTDSGVDPQGIARAVVNMAKGEDTQGGSTITQQYVKNALLGDQSQTVSRKVKEIFISLKVGTKLDKRQILEGYLNTSYFGRGAYGIQAASRTYFGVDAKKLNPSQCAFLAALLKGATLYDPAGNTELNSNATPTANTARITFRWKTTLDQMVQDGHLSPTERAKYTKLPESEPLKKAAQLGGQVGYLVDLAKAYFANNNSQGITSDDLSKGGYEIYTTFDKKKVKQLTDAVEKVRKQNLDTKKRPDTDKFVQFGGASVEPQSGKIVAIYGGEDATKHFTDNADVTGAQVGSTFKPFVLAAAMQHGKRDPSGGTDQPDSDRTPVNPDTSRYPGKNMLKIKDYTGQVWQDKDGKEWLQANDEGYNQPSITLREAMRESVNSAFVQLGMDVGIPTIRTEAEKAGLSPDQLSKSDVPSFSIGISDPSAIRMAGAYGTFAQHGEQRAPYSVEKVLKNGKEIFKHDNKPTQAMPAQVADNVTDVLRTVVDKGTGTNAQVAGREVAGKTGTTDENKSAWFVGYTPQLSTAIDMYRLDDNAKSKDRKFLSMYGTGGQKTIHGASFPSAIFKDYMTAALNGEPVLKFTKPEPIGKAVFGGGLHSPEPTHSPSPSNTPSSTPSDKPSPSDTPQAPPSPSDTCTSFFGCADGGGNDNGGNGNGGNGNGGNGNGGNGTDGGDTGGAIGGPGQSSTASPPGTDTGGADGTNGGNAGTDGALFGGNN